MAHASSGTAACLGLLLLALLGSTRAAASYSIAAWSTDVGEQVMIANYTTNQIQYSYCNSRGSPVYPVDTPNVLPLQRAINDQAPIVGAGWFVHETSRT
jgi:hypothetical protein